MGMKKIFYVLMFLPIIICFGALPLLPDKIPAHYGASGQVDRWGSPYEILLLPVFVILFGLFMLGMAKLSAKQEGSGKNNEKICILAGIYLFLLFNGMTGYILYTSFQQVEDLSTLSLDISQLAFGLLGIVLIVIGNVMPKARMNTVTGLRTTWSMKNETTWKKSQRFGGIALMVSGLLILLVSCLTRGAACIALSLGILLAASGISVLYTYRIAKRY